MHHVYFQFNRHGQSIVSDFRDLLLCAIDNKKEDIARKLLNLGVDSYRMEKVTIIIMKKIFTNGIFSEYENT